MEKVLVVIAGIMPVLLFAQLNESDTLNVKAQLAVTGFYQGGNVETLIFRTKSDASFRLKSNAVFKTQNSYTYQAFGQQKADEDILSLNFLYLNVDKRLYPLLLGFLSTNFRREIDLRYLVGAGLSYNVFVKDKNFLKLSVTSEYEKTDFARAQFNYSEYNGQHIQNTFRTTLWVNGCYQLFGGKVVLNHESYFQPSIQYSNNYRWQADIGIELPLGDFLSLKVNYIHTFESLVIENQKQQDRFLTFGFSVRSFRRP